MSDDRGRRYDEQSGEPEPVVPPGPCHGLDPGRIRTRRDDEEESEDDDGGGDPAQVAEPPVHHDADDREDRQPDLNGRGGVPEGRQLEHRTAPPRHGGPVDLGETRRAVQGPPDLQEREGEPEDAGSDQERRLAAQPPRSADPSPDDVGQAEHDRPEQHGRMDAQQARCAEREREQTAEPGSNLLGVEEVGQQEDERRGENDAGGVGEQGAPPQHVVQRTARDGDGRRRCGVDRSTPHPPDEGREGERRQTR